MLLMLMFCVSTDMPFVCSCLLYVRYMFVQCFVFENMFVNCFLNDCYLLCYPLCYSLCYLLCHHLMWTLLQHWWIGSNGVGQFAVVIVFQQDWCRRQSSAISVFMWVPMYDYECRCELRSSNLHHRWINHC